MSGSLEINDSCQTLSTPTCPGNTEGFTEFEKGRMTTGFVGRKTASGTSPKETILVAGK